MRLVCLGSAVLLVVAWLVFVLFRVFFVVYVFGLTLLFCWFCGLFGISVLFNFDLFVLFIFGFLVCCEILFVFDLICQLL